jgi:alkanesulfonate monooxygenase SsuD/methylene tetrahydromethanopterin reductase-like flavin-dependent oxidoreductase (luciferase family)
LQFVKEGAAEAGRDYSKIKIMAAAPVWIDDNLPKAREYVRWFPALVSNHIVDLLKKYPKDQLPPELVTYVEDRPGYNYLHHAQVGSDNGRFVPDEIVDRYCIVGGVKEQIRRVQELRNLGVHQFNIYLMCGDEEKQVAAYGRSVIPAVNGKRKGAVKKTVKPAKPARSIRKARRK